MAEVIKELISFMISDNADVENIAVSNVFQLTASAEGRKTLLPHKELLVRNLLVVLSAAKRANLKYDSLGSLVNLSMDDEYVNEIICRRAVFDLIVKIVTNENDADAELASALLRNLTRLEKGCVKFLRVNEGGEEGKDATTLLKVFVKPGYNKKNCSLDHLASVFGNVAQLPIGRRVIMKSEGSIFQKLLPFTSHESQPRREGVAAMLRNCCFDETRHDWLLSEDVDLLTHLLLPLAGPEELDDDDMEKLPDALQYLPDDKTREEDASIRLMLLEAVYQLCATRKGRDFLEAKNCYVIIRELHKVEKNEECEAVIYNIVELLMGDQFKDNLKDMEIPDDVMEKLKLGDESEKENDKEVCENVVMM